MAVTAGVTSNTFVLFGISGDLAYKKLFPALYELTLDGVRPRVIGENLAAAVGDGEPVPVSFMAIPPALFDDVAKGLAVAGLRRGRIVVEKPFGRDLNSARELNDILHRHFPEERIFRIDHFLGKEAVMNLLVFRFANAMLEGVWNRHHISKVTITMAEAFDIAGRGSFYDEVGAVRDVVQNHLLQMIALMAMEPPVDDSADALRDEKVKVLRAMRAADPKRAVRGQYDSYLDEPGVAADSHTETFIAMELFIDSWRWSGVPFAIRAGKAMAETVTEAVVEFRPPPTAMFGGADHMAAAAADPIPMNA